MSRGDWAVIALVSYIGVLGFLSAAPEWSTVPTWVRLAFGASLIPAGLILNQLRELGYGRAVPRPPTS
jgi:hypothetical protein